MLVSAALACIMSLALAQDENPVQKIDCPKEVVLPMLPSPRQCPLIELEIGGEKYQFALDTGAVGGRLSPQIVQKLGLKPIRQIKVGDPSGKNDRMAGLYRVPEIKAGGATLYGVQMMSETESGPPQAHADFDGGDRICRLP